MEFEILKKFDQIESYIDQVTAAADRNKKSFGFLPRPAYKEHALQGRLWVCVDENNSFCGYLIFGGKIPSLRVIQIYVQKDKRAFGLAASLLRELERYGEALNCLSVSARVAADLKANKFWELQGYELLRQVDGGKTTGRRINVRIKNLNVPSLFDSVEISSVAKHTDLTVKTRAILANTTYAIDVNVLLDLIKDRDNALIVQQLLGFSMYGNGQICVTSEFVSELERRTHGFDKDPLLSLSRSLPTLPVVTADVLEPIISQLRSVVFPERHNQNILSDRDQSDLKHIAQCIHHEITGFITSENAILKASETLLHSFGIEVISPGNVVSIVANNSMTSDGELIFLHDGLSLTITKFEEKDRQNVECFLIGQGLNESERKKALDSGVVDRSRIRWLVRYENVVIGFSSWGSDELKNHRMFHLIIDEQTELAQKLIDHFIEKMTSNLPDSKLSLIILCTAMGNDLTRKTAIDRGFRKVSSSSTDLTQNDLIKISYKGYITESAWLNFRADIVSIVDFSFPERMPTYDEFVNTGAVLSNKSENRVVKLPLFDIETLFSPAVFLCSGRDAVIVPIKKVYVDRLLDGSKRQLSLLPSNEALMHVEKAYFKSPRNVKLFTRGDLLLFYVSGKDGGQEIIGHGRVTSSCVMDVASAILKLQRQGAVEEQGLHEIADSDKNIHVITFDNFVFFNNPIPYEYLKRHNMISGANLVTAERINSTILTNIINKGDLRE